eukprot:3351903-Prymnesium_polylepis.1
MASFARPAADDRRGRAVCRAEGVRAAQAPFGEPTGAGDGTSPRAPRPCLEAGANGNPVPYCRGC